MKDHWSVRISFLRQPVRSSSLSAAIADGLSPRWAAATSSSPRVAISAVVRKPLALSKLIVLDSARWVIVTQPIAPSELEHRRQRVDHPIGHGLSPADDGATAEA
jgi:hypothetical protein